MRIQIRALASILLAFFTLSGSLSAQSISFVGAQTAVLSSGNDGLAFNTRGDLFIDSYGIGISKLPLGGSVPVSIYNGNTADVAVDPAGNVYALLNTGSVVKLPNGGTGAPVTFLAGLSQPRSLATDTLGNLFVTDSGNHRVLMVTPSGTQTTIGSGFLSPQAIAVDKSGNIYVSDSGNNTIIKITPPATQTTLASNITASRLAVDLTGKLYVSGLYNVFSLAPDGTQTPISPNGSSVVGVAVDSHGNVSYGAGYPQSYIPTFPSANVILVGQSGNSINAFGGFITCPPGGKGVDYVVSGACIATESFNYNVTVGGTLATVALTDGAPNQEFTVKSTTCSGMAPTGTSCNVQVTFGPRYPGLRRGAIQIVDGSGNILSSTLIYGYASGPQLALDSDVKTSVASSFVAPTGAVLDGSGNIYVADYNQQTLTKLSRGGTPLKQIAGHYLAPPGLALDGAGNIYAPSGSNVMKYSPDLASATIVASSLNNPGSLAVDAMGNIFVAESSNSDVVKIPADGSSRITVATPGNPVSISAGPNGSLLVTTASSTAVIVIPPDGSLQTSLGSGLVAPTGVVADKLGNVYVIDSGNGRVAEIPAGGAAQRVVASGLKNPQALALSATGDLVVTDGANVYSVVRSQGPTLTFSDTAILATSNDSPRTVILDNIGNLALATSTIRSTSLGDFGMNLDCGDPCKLNFSFRPGTTGPLANTYQFSTNDLYSQYGFVQSPAVITLTGRGVAGGSQPFITGQTLGPLRNNYSGYVGFQFSVGATPITISSLGRFVAPGNSGSHILKLVNADGTDIPGGTTAIALSGQTAGQFAYASLPSPLTLVSNTYFLVSQETANGDSWYDISSVVFSQIASVNAPVYTDEAGRFIPVSALSGQSYVPLSFQAAATPNPVPSVPFVTGQTLGPLRNDYSGFVGFSFTTAVYPPTIQSLGRFVAPGDNGTHLLKLVDFRGVDVPGSTVSLSTNGAPPGQFAYAALPAPLTLSLLTKYYLVSQETAGGDPWYDRGLVTWNPTSAMLNTPVYTDSSGAYVALSSAFAGQAYVPLNFLYTIASPNQSQGLLLSTVPGRVRNDYTGNVGAAIKIGSTPITVTDLGTFVAPSDFLTHTVKLVTAGGVDVPGGAVSIPLSNALPNSFSFGPLAAPITLAANTTYYLVASELANGDYWFDLGPVIPNSGAAILGPVYTDAAGNYILVPGLANYSYVPVTLRYR